MSAEFDPAMTYTSAARSRSPKYRAVLRSLEALPNRWQKISAGDEVAGWKVLHPGHGQDFPRADDEAIVLTREINGHTITLLSELGREGQQHLLLNTSLTTGEIVIGGVPTGGEIPRPELLERLRPKIFILAGNDAKAQRAFRELRSRGVNVVPTAMENAVTITLQRKSAVVETMKHTRIELR
jgi:hypothetical protein